ncbi:atp-dependent clp atp-binding subunit [Moniliophthora roreri MCA 2997]|uniref:Atp-dependent clp atp-binding subunit n=1 Tax=Moniliophthora roreri (strain MCA 2997) TaxID=1381753 RepID=V2WMU9_MONRO|nr:atp-dependent clp atp-binding subunit [Moniliophthora roreri MCA 2997]KAI3603331.1 atp-dependent clp atp-binding subunit [Moniliophthora roreri]
MSVTKDKDRQQVGLGQPKNGRQSPFGRIRSPPRSPRRTSLLLALRDVIGDANDDEEEGSEEEAEAESNQQPVASTSEIPNFNRKSTASGTTSMSTVRPAPIDISLTESHSSPEPPPLPHDDNELSHLFTLPDTDSSRDLKRLSHLSHVSHLSTLSALSSSLGLSQFPIPPSYTSFSDTAKEEDEEEGDSGFYDSTRPQLRNLPEPLALSPPRTTFDLLASPFGSPSSRLNPNGLMSPNLVSPRDRSPVGPYVPRSPFSGSFSLPHAGSGNAGSVGQMAGYGVDYEPEDDANDDGNVSVESLDSPTIYYKQKEKQAQRDSIFSESDIGSSDSIGSLEILKRPSSGSPSFEGSYDFLKRPDSARHSPLSLQLSDPSEHDFGEEEDTPRSVFEDDDDDDYRFDGDEEMEGDEEEEEDDDEEVEDVTEPNGSGHTSFWDTQDTVVYTGKRQSQPQQPPEAVEFVDDEVQGCSSFRGRADSVATTDLDLQAEPGAVLDDLVEDEEREEETARLAYLITDQENDTLHSLYDVYSDISEEDEAPVADEFTQSNAHIPNSAEVNYLESGIPLPSPTPSEVHAYAILALFDRNSQEQRRVSPSDAWAYEPDESFSSSNSGSRAAAIAALAGVTASSLQTHNEVDESDESFGSSNSVSGLSDRSLNLNMSAASAAAISALAAAMPPSSWRRTEETSQPPVSAAETHSPALPFLRERVFTPPPSSYSQSPKASSESHETLSSLPRESVFTPPPLPSLHSQTPKVDTDSQEVLSLSLRESVFTPPPPSLYSQTPRMDADPREMLSSSPKESVSTSPPPSSYTQTPKMETDSREVLSPSLGKTPSLHSQSPKTDTDPQEVLSPSLRENAFTPSPPSLHSQSPKMDDSQETISSLPMESTFTPPLPPLHSQSPKMDADSRETVSPSLRERVFTPPPPPSSQSRSPIVPQERLSMSQIQHRTPPQQSQPSRPRTPRSAPAATAVYEKDKKRTSTMIEPLPALTLEPKVDENDSVDDEVSGEDEDDDLEDSTAEQEQVHETAPSTAKGLKPLRLSTLLLTDTSTGRSSPILTPSTTSSSNSHLGHGNDAGRQSRDIDSNTNDISRSRLSISSLSLSDAHAHTPSVPPSASTPASAISDSEMFSLFNSSTLSRSTQRLSPQPSFIPMSDTDSTPRPSSSLGLVSYKSKSVLSSVPPSPTRSSSCAPQLLTQRRQSRIHYIRSDIDVPQSAPPPGSTNSATASSYRGSVRSSVRLSLPARDRSSLRPDESSELGMEDSTFTLRHNRLSHIRNRDIIPTEESASTQEDESEDYSIRRPIVPSRHPTPTPIRIPAPSRASSLSIRSGADSPFSAQVRTRSSRTSPLAELDKERQATHEQSPVTPRPTLLFAIASDDPAEVQKVLEASQTHPTTSNALPVPDKGPTSAVTANDPVGPQSQSALEFVLTNEGLRNKLDIVKVLLGYGADPQKIGMSLVEGDGNEQRETIIDSIKGKLGELDDATRYYLSRACSTVTRKTAALMKRSAFRPLERMRYGIIGQDRALEQLFRVLSVHSGTISKTSQPIVVFLCGPSGHGKSLLAHQFGSLLDVPIHTVNMTTLRSADDLWNSYSISSSEDSVPCTLVEFLANNEGKRCVVVLDEIEKTVDAKALWTLLVPWELGRCTFEANSRTIDVRNVIWVGTSNIGQDIILSYHEARERANEMMTREEYVELMGIVRPRLSDQLGASLLSRVSAILPFVPFTEEERRAIASEFISQSEKESELVKEMVMSKEKDDERRWRKKIIKGAMSDFILSEGARSLYRAVSSQLVDSLDDL